MENWTALNGIGSFVLLSYFETLIRKYNKPIMNF